MSQKIKPRENIAFRDSKGRLLPGSVIGLGNKGGGRIKKARRKLEDIAIKEPTRVEELMTLCYQMATTSPDERIRLEAIKYYVDRMEGKPKMSVSLAEEDKNLVTLAAVLKFRQLMDSQNKLQLPAHVPEGEFIEVESVSDEQETALED